MSPIRNSRSLLLEAERHDRGPGVLHQHDPSRRIRRNVSSVMGQAKQLTEPRENDVQGPRRELLLQEFRLESVEEGRSQGVEPFRPQNGRIFCSIVSR